MDDTLSKFWIVTQEPTLMRWKAVGWNNEITEKRNKAGKVFLKQKILRKEKTRMHILTAFIPISNPLPHVPSHRKHRKHKLSWHHRQTNPETPTEKGFFLLFFYHKMANKKIKQDSNTKANKSGEEAQKKSWGLRILGSLRVKNKVNINSKARIKGKNTIKVGIGYLIT